MFVDPQAFPDPQKKYVCWLDIMGTQNKMCESVKTSGVSILRLHGTIVENIKSMRETQHSDIKAYPMMDGGYITSSKQRDMLEFLKHVFIEMANEYIACERDTDSDEIKNRYRTFIRASLAYGPVIEGETIPRSVCATLDSDRVYKQSILLGLPMIQAYANERQVPPFGIFIDESARAFCQNDEIAIQHKWWDWYTCECQGNNSFNSWAERNKQELIDAVQDYFQYAKKHTHELNYDLDRIEVHQELFNEYFNCSNC